MKCVMQHVGLLTIKLMDMGKFGNHGNYLFHFIDLGSMTCHFNSLYFIQNAHVGHQKFFENFLNYPL